MTGYDVTNSDGVAINDDQFDVQNTECSPRWKVALAGYDTFPKSILIELNGHGATDTASFTLSVAGYYDWSVQLQTDVDEGAVDVEFFIGFPNDGSDPHSKVQYVSMFRGLLDDMNPMFDTGDVTFDCRSYGAILTAEKITTTASSHTTVDFINAACKQFGLTPQITLAKGAKPATLAQVFGKELVVGLHNAQLWAVILSCGEVDDCDVWVDGTTLHYENPDSIQRTTQGIQYGRDIISIRGSHSPQRNRNIAVEVRTVNPKTRLTTTVRTVTNPDGSSSTTSKQTFSSSMPMFGGSGQASTSQTINLQTGAISNSSSQSQSSGGLFSTGFTGFSGESSKERYILRIPYQSRDQANARAQAYWNQLSRAQYQIEFDLAITPGLLDVLSITTLWEITALPWDAFNSILAGGGANVTGGGSTKIVNGQLVPDPAPITSATASSKPKEYYARKISIKGDMPQDETDGVQSSGGLTVTITALNHALGNDAV